MYDLFINWLSQAVPKIGLALLILVVGLIVARFFGRMVRRVFEKRNLDPGLGGFLSSFIKSGIVILVWISVLGTLGIQAASFIAILGALGLAMSLAFQGSLANLAGGFITLFFRPFRVGDFIEVSGQMGTVVEISIMYTHLNTPDNRRVIIPNSQMSSSAVINFSQNPTRRQDLFFSISYTDSIEMAKQVIAQVLDNNEMVLNDPAPIIGVSSHGDSAIHLVARFHCKRENFFLVGLGVNEEVKNAFDQAGLTIPFPQRDVHLNTKPLQVRLNSPKS